jgi:hypothetical protein
MGKHVPLRIGRKSKRELNPVERMRRKEKHKKNVKQFMKKVGQKASGEFKSKVKYRRSPSPESNDPLIGELISASKLRAKNIKETEFMTPSIDSLESNPKHQEKPTKKSIIPASLFKKPQDLDSNSDSFDSDSHSEIDLPVPSYSKPLKVSQDQSLYKALLESDSKLSDFFDSVRNLM